MEKGGGSGGAWKKQKKGNAMGHTAKEKLRRGSIVNSCNCFRTLVPFVKDADKATVFRTSVEFMAFLRQRIPGFFCCRSLPMKKKKRTRKTKEESNVKTKNKKHKTKTQEA